MKDRIKILKDRVGEELLVLLEDVIIEEIEFLEDSCSVRQIAEKVIYDIELGKHKKIKEA